MVSSMKTAIWMLFVLLLLDPFVSYADDFTGTRALGMGGAHRAIVTSNDAIYLNPAGMSLFRRYSFEGQYLITPNYGFEEGPSQHVFNASVVDNQIQVFATGLAYTRVERNDDKKGNRFDLAFSYGLTDTLLIGTDVKYINFDRAEKEDAINAVAVDVGLLIRTDFGLSLGCVGYNLTNPADYTEHPVSMAAAIMYAPFRALELSFDWFITFQKLKDITNPQGDKETGYSYHLGAEYLLLGQFTLRAGYEFNQVLPEDDHFWSAGIGYINPSIALDFGYRGSVNHKWDNTFAVGLRLFM